MSLIESRAIIATAITLLFCCVIASAEYVKSSTNYYYVKCPKSTDYVGHYHPVYGSGDYVKYKTTCEQPPTEHIATKPDGQKHLEGGYVYASETSGTYQYADICSRKKRAAGHSRNSQNCHRELVKVP